MSDDSTLTTPPDAGELRIVLRSFCLAGKSASEAFDHICEAYGGDAMTASDSLNLFNEIVCDRRKSRYAIQFCREYHLIGIALLLILDLHYVHPH